MTDNVIALHVEPTADVHDCKGDEGCNGHPDCEFAVCDHCGRPNRRCVCP